MNTRSRTLLFALLLIISAAVLIVIYTTRNRSLGVRAELVNPKATGFVGLSEPAIAGFARADGSRLLSFPQDFGPHLDFQTEWWYYTGNLDSVDGRHFGYQLTFFRRALFSRLTSARRAHRIGAPTRSIWPTSRSQMSPRKNTRSSSV